jgi:hypothetical protein
MMVSTGRAKNDWFEGAEPWLRMVLLIACPVLLGILLWKGAFGKIGKSNAVLVLATAVLAAVRIWTLIYVMAGKEYLENENMAEL